MSPLFLSVFDMVQDRSSFVTREVEIGGVASTVVVDFSKVLDLLYWGFWYLPFCFLFAFLALLATWPKGPRKEKATSAAEK